MNRLVRAALALLATLTLACEAQGGGAPRVWVQPFSTGSPPSRTYHALAFDSGRGRAVLFGGSGNSGSLLDTWEWDGTSWTETGLTTSPPARYSHALAYDSRRGRTVLFGGLGNGVALSDTWEWDGTTWTQRTPATFPSARYSHALAYDSLRGRTVLFGGYNGNVLSDTWEWDGTNWTKANPASSPLAREYHALAFDSRHGQTVLFGGYDNTNLDSDTWEWNGTTWTQASRTTSPPARELHALGYDSVRGRTVLFGGLGNGGALSDTWEWDGTTWTSQGTSSSPPARSGLSLAYDTFRSRTVLFGGQDSSSVNLSDTWTLASYATPVANPGTSRTINLPGFVTLDGSASGVDPLLTANYAWARSSTSPGSGPIVSLAGASTATATFTPPTFGTYTFILTVSDQRGITSTSAATAAITITANTVPTVTAGPDRSVHAGRPVTLTATASDLDRDPLTYLWSQHSGNTVSLSGLTSSVASFSTGVTGTYGFAVTVSDGRGGVATASLTITITNSPPSVSVPAHLATLLNQGVSLNAAVSDPDGDPLTYAWTRVDNGPPVTLSNSNTPTASFTPISAGQYTFRFTSMDPFGATSSAVVIVTANNPPTARAGIAGVGASTVYLPAPVALDGSASSDTDGDTLAYVWSFASLPAGSRLTTAAFSSPASALTSFSPDVAGTYRVELLVTDSFNATSTAFLTVTAISTVLVDPPPVSLIVPEQPSAGALAASLRTLGTTVALQQLDCKIVFDAAHLSFASHNVNAQIPFTYTDNSTSGLLSTLLDVLFQKISAQGSPLGTVDLVDLTFNATVPKLPFDAVTLLSVTAKSQGTPNGLTLFRPSADPGILQSVVTRRLNGVASWPSPLAPPTANLRPFLQLDGRASRDPNARLHPLSYAWSVLPGTPPGSLANPQTPTPTFVPSTPDAVGLCRFALTVSNGVLQSPTAEAEIDLNVAARAPTAIPFATTPLGDQKTGVGLAPLVVVAGTTVELDGSFSTTPTTAVRGALTYAWSQTGGPALGTPITSSAHASIVLTAAGAYTIQLVVTDPAKLASPPETVTLLAIPPQHLLPKLALVASSPPNSLTTGPDEGDTPDTSSVRSLTANVNAQVEVTATAIDPDVGQGTVNLAFFWRQLAGPAVAIAQASAGKFASVATFSPSMPVPGVYEFECVAVATDTLGATLGIEVERRIRVIVNQPDAQAVVPSAEVQVSASRAKDTGPRASSAPTVSPGQTIVLSGAGSAGAIGAMLGYQWKQVQGPQVVLSSAYSAVTSFVAPDFGDGVTRQYGFALYVEDQSQTLVSEPVVVTIAVGGSTSLLGSSVTLKPGLDLISVPVNPSSTHVYNLADLARDTGSLYVIYSSPGPDGREQMKLWSPGSTGPTPVVTATSGYLVRGPAGGRSVSFLGSAWPQASFTKALSPGVNLIGVPSGLTSSFDAEQLRVQVQAGLVARTVPDRPGFQLHVPGLSGAPFSLTTGSGYLVVTPAGGATLDLRKTTQ